MNVLFINKEVPIVVSVKIKRNEIWKSFEKDTGTIP